jgi:hypothetical protein
MISIFLKKKLISLFLSKIIEITLYGTIFTIFSLSSFSINSANLPKVLQNNCKLKHKSNTIGTHKIYLQDSGDSNTLTFRINNGFGKELIKRSSMIHKEISNDFKESV